MKGLILKDLYTLKKQFSFIGVYILLFTVFSLFMNNMYVFAVISLIVVMSPMTAMAYDAQCAWGKYVNSLPIKRSTVILSRYVLGLLLLIPMFAYDIIVNMINLRKFNLETLYNSLFIAVLLSAVSIIVLSFMLPFLLKFGTEKGRIIVILFSMVIGGVAGAFLSININETMTSILLNKVLFCAGMTAIAVIALVLSILISIKIYNKKEF